MIAQIERTPESVQISETAKGGVLEREHVAGEVVREITTGGSEALQPRSSAITRNDKPQDFLEKSKVSDNTMTTGMLEGYYWSVLK